MADAQALAERETLPNPYYQPPQRNVIQVERPESRDWIVWNWDTASWDESKYNVAAALVAIERMSAGGGDGRDK